MKINWHKEIYSVTMNDRPYARINGVWHVHTSLAANELQWSLINKDYSGNMINKLETEFQILIRQEKLDNLLIR